MKRMLLVTIINLWFTGLSFSSSKEEIIIPHKEISTPTANHLLLTMQKDLQDPRYRQDILPCNFSYPTQLLDYGIKSNQSPQFAYNVFSLFSKLLKGSEYVNAYSFSGFIAQMPDLLKSYFAGYNPESSNQLILANDLDMLERLQRSVSSIVYTKFSQDFATCKTNPELFLEDLTKRIVMVTTQEVTREQLRQIIIRFLEVGLSKLVWSPRDEEKTWELVKTISQNIASFMQYNIIDDLNDIDELFWTLVHRYRYFLELHSTDMSLTFYQKIKNDIINHKILLFELEEQEPFLQPKSACLLNTILAQEAKKRAYELPTSHTI
jgi:hypothetical protein